MGGLFMEYAKDEIFNITYNSSKNKLEMKKESWASKLWRKIKKHRFMSVIFLLFFMFSILNIVLINYFLVVLQEIS